MGSGICRDGYWAGKLLSDNYIGVAGQQMNIFNYITIITTVIMIILILVQTRGASLGAGLGGAGEVNTTRRGTDKTIFQLTIICAIVFSLSLILGVIYK